MVKVIVKDNGPIRIEGDFELLNQNGDKYNLEERKAISLCRCGQSEKMPFCDGKHKSCDFKSEFVINS